MTRSYRICPSCGHANEAQAYECAACRSSLNGTIPGALQVGAPIPEAQPTEEDSIEVWVSKTEAAIADAETCCQQCQAPGPVTRHPFGLANIAFKFDWLLLTSVAASAVMLPLGGPGILAWGWKRRGVAFRMNLVLCPDCLYQVEDFYGRPVRDSYRLHPCYAMLEEEGFERFVSGAEFENWQHVPTR
jgi:hypothetical protein